MSNLYKAIVKAGWSALDCRTNSRTYADSAGSRYGTVEKASVRITLTLGETLAVSQRGDVIVYSSHDSKGAILRALIVDPDKRRTGRAGQAMQELARLSDAGKNTVNVEPVPIADKPVKPQSLLKFYERFGFLFNHPRNLVMVRQPIKQGKTPRVSSSSCKAALIAAP